MFCIVRNYCTVGHEGQVMVIVSVILNFTFWSFTNSTTKSKNNHTIILKECWDTVVIDTVSL